MNLRKKIFVFGGILLIIVILAIKFKAFDFIKRKVDKQEMIENNSVQSNPEEAREILQKRQESATTIAEEDNKIVQAKVQAKETAQEERTQALLKNDVVEVKSEVKPEVKATVKEPVKSAETTQTTSDSAINASLGMGNPFAYSSSSGDDYSPISSSRRVGLISIKGIISIEGQPARAILHINDTNTSYYVSKGDVIRINTKAKSGSLVTEAYISVKDIRKEEVELVQQERPDQVIIIR